MSERSLNTRIQNKIDTTANWAKATNFVPKKGEIIVYSDGGGTGIPKMKVGDGTTKVGSLKFIIATVPDASDTVSGIVNTGEQTFGGNKTFKGYTRFITGGASSGHGIAMGTADSSSPYMYLDKDTLGFGIQNASGGSTQTRLTFSNNQIEVRGAIVSSTSNPYKNLGSSDSPWTNGYITNLHGNADTATTATTASKVSNSLSINGKSYNGSAAIDVGVIGAEYGGSGQNTLAKSAEAYVGALSKAATSYALNDEHKILTNIPAGTSTYKIPLSNFYTYMKGKMDSIYQAKGAYLTSLPVASSSALGGVKIGSGLTVAEDGTISAAAEYTLPTASSTTKGGIKVGTGLTMSSETLNHSNSITAKTAYGSTATTASANGGSITVTDIKYDAQGHITGSTDRKITLSQTTYTLAGLMGSTAKGSATQPVYWNGSAWTNTTYTLGKSVPTDAKFTDTVYSLPAATATTLGGIIAGEGLSITTDGKLSVSKVPHALSINGKSFDGSAAIDVGVIGAAYGGSGETSLSASANAYLNSLPYNSAPEDTLTDNHIFFTNDPTGQTNCSAPMSKVYTYMKGKLDSVYQPVGSYLTAIPKATTSVLGGIKLGTGLTASADGTVNVSVGGATITLKTWTDADVA